MGELLSTSPGRHVELLAARAWPADDLAKRARKTKAVLHRAGVFGRDLDTITAAEVVDVEKVFGQIETGDAEAWPRGDGTYEIRSATLGQPRPKRKGRR